ncbi:MAG: hypothetical protein ACRDVG_01115 [Jatrophihabitantaceae bacterium]
MTQPPGEQPQQGPPYGQQPGGPPPYNPQPQYDPRQQSQQQGQGYAGQHYGQQQPPPPRPTATSKGTFSVAAAIFAAVAAVLGILSLFVLGWYRNNFASVSGGASASSKSKFSNIHDALDSAQHALDSNPSASKYIHFGVAPTYFGWLGYLLIIAAVVLTFVSAASLGGAVVAVKAFSALVAAAGLALTFWAIDLVSFDSQLAGQLQKGTPSGYGDFLKHTSFGAWAMMVAFLLCLIGSLVPPKHKAVVTQYGSQYGSQY